MFLGRPFMTSEEAEEYTRRAFEANADRPPSSPEVFGRATNEFWLERGPLAMVGGRTMTSLIVDPVDGRLPALTARGQAQTQRAGSRRFDRADDLSLALRCLRSAAGPPYFPAQPDANFIRITQSRDHVAIVQEKYGETRIVRLNGGPHVAERIRSWMGDSVGRWDGDSLVVETTNFTDKLALGNRFDENLRLMERFTRTTPDVLLYEVRVDDPTAFARPWTFVLPMRRTGEELFEFACHEGNYSLANILRGARAEERSNSGSAERPR
jgi:hypothetical protein